MWKKFIQFIFNSLVNIFALFGATLYLTISIEPLKEMKDIFHAIKRNWTILLWLLAAFIFFAIAAYSLYKKEDVYVYLFNTIGTILACVFVNFITRESVNFSNEKANEKANEKKEMTYLENLTRIYLRLAKLPPSAEVNDIMSAINDRIKELNCSNKISEEIKIIEEKKDANKLIKYTNYLISNDYAAIASTSGLTVSQQVIDNTIKTLKN